MEMYNGKIAVTYEELTSAEGGAPVVGRGVLKVMLSRHPELRLHEGHGMGNYTRIDYYNLREHYRKRFEAKYGDPRRILAKEAARAELSLVMDERARSYYAGYRYEKRGEMTALPESVIDELTLNASVLNRMIEITARRRAMRSARGCNSNTRELLEGAFEMYERLRDAYGHSLPASVERLRGKITAYRRDGYASLISGKWGNSSATVITEEAGRYLVALKRSRVPVYTETMMFEEFNRYSREHGWKQLRDPRAMRDYLNRNEIRPLWYDAVYGELTSHQKFSRKNSTDGPSMRDSLWYGDGTKLNLYYREWVKNNKGGGKWVVRTLQVYEVIDAYSEMMLGYCISETENFEAQYAAYRMAVATTGHRPYEVVHDNQGGHRKLDSENFLNRLPTGVHRPTAPNSGQSKTIESVFGRFQNEYLRRRWGFTGMNITAVKESSRANIELIGVNKDSLPTRQELEDEYCRARQEWNTAAHPKTGVSRAEMYATSDNPEAGSVSERDMVEIFWLTCKKPITYTSSGLKLTIGEKSYQYEVCRAPRVPDHEFYWKNNSREFWVKYDPCDMRSVRLYSKDDNGLRFERIAETKVVVQRNIQEQKEGDRKFISEQIAADIEMRKRLQVEARVIEREHGMSLEEHGLKRPAISGVRKEVNEEVEREVAQRTRHLRAQYFGKLTPAQFAKEASLAVLDPETGKWDRDPQSGETETGEYRIASKM